MSIEAARRPRSLRQIAVLATCLPLVLLSAAAQEATTSGKPPVTIKELMEKTITPATNTIWNAYDAPTTDEQWQALEEAAVTLLAAAYVNSVGGAGPMDAEWVEQPSWQAFNEVMTAAARDALAAVRARDHDALLVASDVLYPPCESCHMQFNPGVVDAQ